MACTARNERIQRRTRCVSVTTILPPHDKRQKKRYTNGLSAVGVNIRRRAKKSVYKGFGACTEPHIINISNYRSH